MNFWNGMRGACWLALLALPSSENVSRAQCQDYGITLINGPDCPVIGGGAGGEAIAQNGAVAGVTNNCAVSVIFLWTGGPGFQSILPPPNTDSFKPYAINNAQQVVGYRIPINDAEQGIFVQNGVVNDLPSLAGADRSTAYGISNDGTIVGFSEDKTAESLLAVRWVQGEVEQIPMLLGPSSVAYDISDSGFICGWMGIHPHPLFGASAFIYKHGCVYDLALITSTSNTEAHAVNNLGEACGTTWTFTDPKDPIGSTIRRGFIWSGKNVQDIGALPGHVETYVNDLNDAATIVGYCLDQKGFSRAFMWHNGLITDLNDFIPADSGFKFESAEAINNAGQITGHVRYLSGYTAAIVLSPMPSTPGDYDCDEDVDVDDLLGIINRWGPVIGNHPADFNDDGQVNVSDLLTVIDNWTK